jgi:hypothetical protein
VPYADLLAGRVALPDVVPPGAVVRLESPDEDFGVQRALLALGAEAAAGEPYESLPAAAVARLAFERGRLLPARQWYLGFRRALAEIERQLAGCPPHRLMSHPADVAVMFDKRACHRRLAGAGVAVPRALGPVGGFEELRAAMAAGGCRRVFVKLAHGSSASGVVAYRTDGRRHRATTTVEAVAGSGAGAGAGAGGGGLRLYNSRRLRTVDDPGAIAALVDAVCRHRVHVEEWLPKAGHDGHTFDLRVVVIAGRSRHTVVRLARGPVTNLHLDNKRQGPAALRARMGEAAWAAAAGTCERAVALFERSLYAGVDLLVQPGLRRHAVLEVNAFGDLLLETLHEGRDTYSAEVLALQADGAAP